jgi:stage II sporulation protein D
VRRAPARRLVPFVVVAVAGGACGPPLEPIDTPPAPRALPPREAAAPAAEPEPFPRDPAPADPRAGTGPLVRVALLGKPRTVPLAGEGAWRLLDARGGVLVRARAGERWSVEQSGARLRARRADGTTTSWTAGAITQFPEAGALLRHGTRRYRGALRLVPTDSGVLAVNLLPLEDYLRGVVPLEIGNRRADERAAVEAQAVAARSFTVTRLVTARAGNGRSPDFDLIASVGDQVYGGHDAELPLANVAVDATAGLVLRAGTRVVIAPFHSTCGGETAAAEEVWRSDGEPHLKRVSDRIPGSDRYYCDIAPRFAWTRVLSGSELDGVVRRYLGTVASVGPNGAGNVRELIVDGRTPSGRVARLVVRAANGSYRVRGNDARSVLRSPGGELLNSAYFSVTTEPGSGGRIARVVIRGNGYGHGVGMCQWGAIGRSRAGQDARTILRTYFPGTSLGPIPPGLLTP